jgi:hypothetical protein
LKNNIGEGMKMFRKFLNVLNGISNFETGQFSVTNTPTLNTFRIPGIQSTLLTGYEGNSKFIDPEIPTIPRIFSQ